LSRVVRAAVVTSPTSPRTLCRAFCTAGLISRVPLQDKRHADARTTICYDMVRADLDRHAAHSVAAYLAGMAVG
jgi:integrase/recombinase XerD